MTLQKIKKAIIQAIDANAERIIAIGKEIEKNPEMGYKEEHTSALVREELERLGLAYQYPLAVTGVKARLAGSKGNVEGNDSEDSQGKSYNICIIGEMDALKCAGSPIANGEDVAHACGHNAQVAAMLGAAMGLAESGIMKELDGSVTFMAVPAEEFIDMDYRRGLRDAGRIQYFGGKQQLIAEGAFDDVDMAMMLHAEPNEKEAKVYVRGYNLGFLAKTLTFHGKAVHGSTPFDGVNALNAAALAILGVHANRETFREEERIRIHPIITKGGDVVNSVPDEVVIDTYVRGASFQAIEKGDRAVERAAKGAAEMVGATASVENIPGYLPLKESLELSGVLEANVTELLGAEKLVFGKEITGSTDIGDLSSIIPVIQPSIGGFEGALHAREFHVSEPDTAYVLSAKILALTAAELLHNHSEKARKVKESFVPQMTKEVYLKYLENTAKQRDSFDIGT